MLSTAKGRAEATIINRRKQEAVIGNLSNKLRQEFSEKQYADWANKGKSMHLMKNAATKVQQLKDAYKANLDIRKTKLAQLLETENAALKEELRGLIETPEQVRQRMINRVEELKYKREGDRKEFVDKMLKKRFDENADELRKVASELEELRVDFDRDQQMVEKQDIMVEKWKGI